MEDVRADLAAPLDLLHLALDVRHLLLTLALAQLQQARLQHADTVLAVVHLIAVTHKFIFKKILQNTALMVFQTKKA